MPIADGDTLATLAQTALVDVGYLGGVNAGVANLLQVDPAAPPTITIGGNSTTVTAGDTLTGIASRLGVDGDAVVAAAADLPVNADVALIEPQPANEPVWQALRVFTDLAGPVADDWKSWVAPETGAGAAPGPAPVRCRRRGTAVRAPLPGAARHAGHRRGDRASAARRSRRGGARR